MTGQREGVDCGVNASARRYRESGTAATCAHGHDRSRGFHVAIQTATVTESASCDPVNRRRAATDTGAAARALTCRALNADPGRNWSRRSHQVTRLEVRGCQWSTSQTSPLVARTQCVAALRSEQGTAAGPLEDRVHRRVGERHACHGSKEKNRPKVRAQRSQLTHHEQEATRRLKLQGPKARALQMTRAGRRRK
jgi:hypothetical protein